MSSKLEADFGVGWLTMILGVGGGSRSFFRGENTGGRDEDAARGGERTLAVFVIRADLWGRNTSLLNSVVDGDGSRGVPAAESAL